jgi:hypothetical protein
LHSGLDINGEGTGAIGIRVMSAQGVVIRDTIVTGFGERGISPRQGTGAARRLHG